MAIINPFTFLLSRTIAQNRGVSDAEANRLGFVGSVVRPPFLGVVLASAIASNEAASAATATASAGTRGSTSKLGSGPGSTALSTLTTVPDFHGMTEDQAERWAHIIGLKIKSEGDKIGKINWQEPAKDKPPPKNKIITVRFAE